jgi:ribonuclease VapC
VTGSRLVLDAQPLVAAIRQEPVRPAVVALLEAARRGEVDLEMSAVNAGEVLYAVERALGPAAAHAALLRLQAWPIAIVAADLELASRAGWFKLTTGLGYADAFAAALAHRDDRAVVTGDAAFDRAAAIVPVVRLDGPAA